MPLKTTYNRRWSRLLFFGLPTWLICCLLVAPLTAQTGDEVLTKDQLTRYRSVKLTTDLSHLNDNQRQMLIDDIMMARDAAATDSPEEGLFPARYALRARCTRWWSSSRRFWPVSRSR